MKYLRYISIMMIAFVIPNVANANDDTLRHLIRSNIAGSINRTADGVTYLLNNSANYSYNQKWMTVNVRAGMVFGQSLNNLTNRDYNAGGDYNIYWTEDRKWYAWGLANGLISYSLKVNHQVQLGGGMAWNAINNKQVTLNISDGLLYEQSEIISGEGELINYATVRNSLRINFRYTWNEKITFRTSNIWQPSLTISNDNIFNSNSDIQIKIWKWINFNAALQYNQISRTQKENLLFTYGIAIQHKF